MKRLAIAVAGLALVVGLGPAAAQTLLLTLNSPDPDPGGRFGHSLAIGDVDGDGKGDIAEGSPWEDVGATVEQGRAYVFSGANGSVLLTLDSPNPQGAGYFGKAVAVGDINGDGKADVAVGAPQEDVGPEGSAGRVYVFSGADGGLLHTLTAPAPDGNSFFGSSVAVGELDGDSKDDIVVGEPGRSVAGWQQGRVYAFSGADGSVLSTLDSPVHNPAVSFGRSVAVGDVDGDSQGDIVVGLTATGSNYGSVYVFSGASGPPSLTLSAPDSQFGDGFGFSVAVGDVDDDGKGDVAVGAWQHDVGLVDGQGRAYVFSGANGAVIHVLDTPNPETSGFFGYSVGAADVDDDGKADIGVGAWEENSFSGRAYVFSGADGSVLYALDSPNPTTNGHFGESLALGDVSGDAKPEMAVGEPLSYASPAAPGNVYVFSFLDPLPAVGGIAELPDVAGAPLETDGSSGSNRGLLAPWVAIGIATGAMALGGAAWYARRRWVR